MSKALLAVGDNIEFGWMVAAHIPHLRYLSKKYEKTIIVCRPSNRYLFEDFADLFYDYWDNKAVPDMWFAKRFPNRKVKIPKAAKKLYPKAHVVTPSKKTCMSKKRKYFMYGKVTDEKGYDVIIHARAEDKYGQAKLNYNPVKYKKMLKQLRLEHDIKACSIGLRGKAYHIDGTSDQRDIPLIHLCYLLRNAKVCVGTSSGVMHLSHLCGCPIVVLTDDKIKKGIKATNRQRYEKIWRAFPDVPVKVIDNHGWHPPVASLVKRVRKFL